MKRTFLVIVFVAFAAMLAAGNVSAQAQTASAQLKNASGQVVGTATFTQQAGGVKIAAQVKGLAAGKHGIHIHAVGKCDAPDFTTAGGHFNPDSKQHGTQNPAGSHAGDLPNLVVGADGSGSIETVDTRITLAAGAANSVFDTDGSALVIHASEDDEKTDPTGNSGARIACGALAASILPASGAAPDATAAMALAALGLVLLGGALVVRTRRA